MFLCTCCHFFTLVRDATASRCAQKTHQTDTHFQACSSLHHGLALALRPVPKQFQRTGLRTPGGLQPPTPEPSPAGGTNAPLLPEQTLQNFDEPAFPESRSICRCSLNTKSEGRCAELSSLTLPTLPVQAQCSMLPRQFPCSHSACAHVLVVAEGVPSSADATVGAASRDSAPSRSGCSCAVRPPAYNQLQEPPHNATMVPLPNG